MEENDAFKINPSPVVFYYQWQNTLHTDFYLDKSVHLITLKERPSLNILVVFLGRYMCLHMQKSCV